MAISPRTLLLLSLPAAAVGALAGFVLTSFGAPPGPATGTGGAGDAASPPSGAGGGTAPRVRVRPPRARSGDDGSVRPDRSRVTRRVIGHQDAADALDPAWAARLSSPDAHTREEAAAALLRMGTARAPAIDQLEPTTEEGRRLRDAIANAQSSLAAIERGTDYPLLAERGRLEIRLTCWLRVVPESRLRPERLQLASAQVAADEARRRDGGSGGTPGTEAWHRLELARVRHELGEIDDSAWAAARDADLPAFRDWVSKSVVERGVDPGRIRDLKAALERIESAR